jgi:hypothetical protein
VVAQIPNLPENINRSSWIEQIILGYLGLHPIIFLILAMALSAKTKTSRGKSPQFRSKTEEFKTA